VLLELYGEIAKPKGARYIFVTHNVNDFSLPQGDQRKPHPDLEPFFSKIRSRYFIRLADALRAVRFNAFQDALYDTEMFDTVPRRPSEIYAVIEELTDRVWYDRHMVSRWKVETGKTRIIPKAEFGPKLYRASARDKVVVDDIWAGALKSAERVEKKYGKENLGPYSKFDWGMINGKLSALRCVMGDEWDMLDT
jgi:hypothetical protein